VCIWQAYLCLSVFDFFYLNTLLLCTQSQAEDDLRDLSVQRELQVVKLFSGKVTIRGVRIRAGGVGLAEKNRGLRKNGKVRAIGGFLCCMCVMSIQPLFVC
jgi:hypothetical protein